MSKRVEFTLSMPNRGSWNGGWSGAERRYAVVRTVSRAAAEALDGQYFYYSFGDGWGAGVSARVMDVGERRKPSDGFCGYDWMVTSILADGEIYGPARPKPAIEDAS